MLRITLIIRTIVINLSFRNKFIKEIPLESARIKMLKEIKAKNIKLSMTKVKIVK
jgi:hypothetical protein